MYSCCLEVNLQTCAECTAKCVETIDGVLVSRTRLRVPCLAKVLIVEEVVDIGRKCSIKTRNLELVRSIYVYLACSRNLPRLNNGVGLAKCKVAAAN